MFRMSERKNNTDCNAMNVAELENFFQRRRVSVSGYLKTCGNRLRSRKNGFTSGHKL